MLAVSKKVSNFAIPISGRPQSGRTEDSLAQLVEHNAFNVGVSGSSPERVTKEASLQTSLNALLAQLV